MSRPVFSITRQRSGSSVDKLSRRVRLLSRMVPVHLLPRALIVGAALSLVTSVAPVSAIAASTPTASTSIIRNGCFTAPSVSSSWGEFGPGSKSIPSWTISGSSVDDAVDAAKSGWQPPPGCGFSVDLSGSAPGSVSQTVTTTPGANYELRWYLSGNWNCAPTVKTMHVVWDGQVVDAPTFNTTGLNATSMRWVLQSVMVKATSTESNVRFGDASIPPSQCGAILGGVSLYAASVVNGFSAANLSGSFGTAESSMLMKIPSTTSVPVSAPDCRLTGDEANQVQGGGGLQLVWTVSTSSRFLHEATAARLAGATTVEEYLVSLLKSSMSIYSAALQAERVPEEGSQDLANWWGVDVQAISTTGALMSFEVVLTKSGTTTSWTNVPSVPSTAGQSMASEALGNLLYYSKSVAV